MELRRSPGPEVHDLTELAPKEEGHPKKKQLLGLLPRSGATKRIENPTLLYDCTSWFSLNASILNLSFSELGLS